MNLRGSAALVLACIASLILLHPTISAGEDIQYPKEWGADLLASVNGAMAVANSPVERNDRGASALIDGKNSKGSAPYFAVKMLEGPRFAEFRLKASSRIGKFVFLNEQRNWVKYQAKDIRILTSVDGRHWEPLQDFVLTKSPKMQVLDLKSPVTTQFLRFEILSNYGDYSYTIMEEIAAFGPPLGAMGVFRGTTKHDVMELKNGDTLTGSMLNKKLEIQTSYARLVFAKKQLASVILEGDIANIEKIIAVNGDAFSGFILDKTIRFRLSTGPKIDVPREKIKRLGIRIRPEEKKGYPRHDIIVLKNGDTFSGRIQTPHITVLTSYATVPTKTQDIGLIKFIGKNRVVARVTLRNGNTMQGLLQEEDIAIDLDYGPEILIYQDKIDRIEFQK